MSSTRIATSLMLMTLLVITSAVYASNAFPLTAAGNQVAATQTRSLEQRAHQVTPENPIPRRIAVVEPDMPATAEAVGARGTISIYVTLDESGRVGEARPVGMSIRTANPRFDASFMDTSWRGAEGLLGRSDPRVRQAVDAMVDSALAAVRQWQYDPPFQGPLSFTVVTRFGPPPPPPPPPPVPATRSSRAGIPPPPAPAERSIEVEPDGAVRVGGRVGMPAKIVDVRPIYPAVAQQARVQGVVIVEARIEKDGRVGDVRVLRSIPLLDQAAVEAVWQWRFTPTLLNGVPTPLIATLTVNFKLEE